MLAGAYVNMNLSKKRGCFPEKRIDEKWRLVLLLLHL